VSAVTNMYDVDSYSDSKLMAAQTGPEVSSPLFIIYVFI
jgi:hypothetical protein